MLTGTEPGFAPRRPGPKAQLTFVPDGDDVVVGHPGTDAYVVLTPDGALTAQRLADGYTPTEVGDWYQREYGEPLDIDDFIASLTESGLYPFESVALRPVGWQRVARAVFSPVTALSLLALMAVAVWCVSERPRLFPHPNNVFFTRSALAVALLAAIGQPPLLLVHEAGHALAARKLGLPSRLRISRRLYFLVFETHIPGLLGVPRRRRYLCLLAGMLADLTVVAALTTTAGLLFEVQSRDSFVGRLCLAIVYPVCLRLAVQFVVMLRTDVYYIAATALRCHDLQGVATAIVRNAVARACRRPRWRVSLDSWTERDVTVGRWYAPVWTSGIAVLLAVWVVGVAPVLIKLVERVWGPLAAGPRAPDFAGNLALVVLTFGQFALLLLVGRRDKPRPAGNNPSST